MGDYKFTSWGSKYFCLMSVLIIFSSLTLYVGKTGASAFSVIGVLAALSGGLVAFVASFNYKGEDK